MVSGMALRDYAITITLAGAALVVAACLTIYLISRLVVAPPALYFLVLAFVAIPAMLLLVGAGSSRAAYFNCRGPNFSVGFAAMTALVSAILGVTTWVLLGAALGHQDAVTLHFDGYRVLDYAELAIFVIGYAMAGAIGGIVYYFLAHGRLCQIDQKGALKPREK